MSSNILKFGQIITSNIKILLKNTPNALALPIVDFFHSVHSNLFLFMKCDANAMIFSLNFTIINFLMLLTVICM